MSELKISETTLEFRQKSRRQDKKSLFRGLSYFELAQIDSKFSSFNQFYLRQSIFPVYILKNSFKCCILALTLRL